MNNLLTIICLITLSSFWGQPSSAQNVSRFLQLNDEVKPDKGIRFIEGIEIFGGPEPTDKVSFNNASKPGNSTTLTKGIFSIEDCQSLQFKYALMLNREVETLTNVKLLSFIDSWWGTRYRYGGTSRKGIDCSAFSAQLFCDVFSMSLPRTARDQYNSCKKIQVTDMQEGDLLFFNTRGGISHVGVYLGDNYFIHASTSNGVMISSLDESYYKSRFKGAGRLPSENSADSQFEEALACED